MTDIDDVVSNERLLLDPAVRSDPDRVLALLHPDFLEFGASGRRWTAASAAEATARAAADGERIEARGFEAVRLADDVVLLTFEAHRAGQVSLRSSVWVRTASGWQLRFTQGTVTSRSSGSHGGQEPFPA